MFGKTTTPEVPTTERFIDVVIGRVECEKHLDLEKSIGIKQAPCYILTSDTPGKTIWGICNWRARQAGFVGVPVKEVKAKKTHTQWNRTQDINL